MTASSLWNSSNRYSFFPKKSLSIVFRTLSCLIKLIKSNDFSSFLRPILSARPLVPRFSPHVKMCNSFSQEEIFRGYIPERASSGDNSVVLFAF